MDGHHRPTTRQPHRIAAAFMTERLGTALARLEIRLALEALLRHTPNGFRLDGPIVPTRFPEIGALRVPLKFDRMQ